MISWCGLDCNRKELYEIINKELIYGFAGLVSEVKSL